MLRIVVTIPDAPEIGAFVLLEQPDVIYINSACAAPGIIRLVQPQSGEIKPGV